MNDPEKALSAPEPENTSPEAPTHRLRYDFEYTEHSTYARAARLIDACAERGLVIDLGCGPGVLEAPLRERGFSYLGGDVDAEALAVASSRGIDVLRIDVADLVHMSDRIVAAVAGRAVSAVSMLDVIEHLPDPANLLDAVTHLIDAVTVDGRQPLFVVSIPNVSHADLGAKLVTGRWDVTEVGLLDETHITLFNEERLHDVMTRAGFVEVAADDNVHDRTEQEFPADHPAIGRVTVLSQFLRSLRRHAGRTAETYQFIRCYRRAERDEHASMVAALAPRPTGRPGQRDDVDDGPFLSVVVRTQGQRSSLLDTLTSLAAQSDRDLEVLLMVHHDDPVVAARIQSLVDGFEPAFAAQVDVVRVVGGGRSRPLNEALARASGRYVALLDDDDLAVANWVEAFKDVARRAPGTIVRAPCVLQWTERRTGVADVEPVSGFEAPYPLNFDYLDHVRRNRSPPCMYALPMAAIEALGVTFDESLEACEDWKFLMQVARWTGVTDLASTSDGPVPATSVYRRSRDGGGADGVVGTEAWHEYHVQVAHDLAAEPSIVPAGSLMKVRQLYELVEQRDETIVALRNRIDALERSRVWRLTRPLRRIAGLRARLPRRSTG